MISGKQGVLERGLSGIRGAIERVFSGKSVRERLFTLFLTAVHFFLGVFFSGARLPFTETSLGSPLAEALVSSTGKYTLGAFVGAFYGALSLGDGSFSRILALGMILGLRVTLSFLYTDKKGGFQVFGGATITTAISVGVAFWVDFLDKL